MNAWRALDRVRRHPAARDTLAVGLLAAIIFTLHHQSLHYGLFMDDHAHCRQLQECDWSLAGLTGACRLELVGGVADLWFMPDCTLRFFRPLAFGFMKLTYTLSGWDPFAMHVASLGWHLLACTLLMVLLRRLGASAWLSWAVAGLFAAHPAQLATVQWIACQTEMMVTVFLLGATLCYLRFRGWNAEPGQPPRGAYGWAAACVLLFTAALGCRENAIMFPAVMLGVEHLLWRQRTRQAVVLWIVLGTVVVIYWVVRSSYLAGAALPPKPYVIPLSDPGFLRFLFDKVCYYLLGEFLLAPSVPFAGLDYLRGRPLAFYGLSAAVVVLLVAVYARYLRRRPGLLAPAWLLGFMAPVLPVFAAPHHLYLPGIGWAITAMLILRGIGGTAAGWFRLRRIGMWICILLLGALFGVCTLAFGGVLDTAQQVEDKVATEVATARRGLRDGDTLYLVNLPLIAHYVRLDVERRSGLHDLTAHVLTWSPRVLGLVGTGISSEITWVDERTIEVRIAGDRYFGGPLGRMVAETLGPTETGRPSWPARGEGFLVEVLEEDDEGISALRFTFDEPVSQAGRHLFWGSRVRWALELEPDLTP